MGPLADQHVLHALACGAQHQRLGASGATFLLALSCRLPCRSRWVGAYRPALLTLHRLLRELMAGLEARIRPSIGRGTPLPSIGVRWPVRQGSQTEPVKRPEGDIMTRHARSFVLVTFCLVLVAGLAYLGTPRAAFAEEAKAKDIVDTAVAAGQFNTLAAALKAAGLVDTLKGAGPFTVFAPTDDAFAKLPKGTLDDLLKPENKEKLVAILTYHVVAGKMMAADIKDGDTCKTVNGKQLTASVKDGKVMVGGATVTKADVATSNGVIHVIDAVMLP